MGKNKHTFLIILLGNILLVILKYTFGITLLIDGWGYILWLLVPTLIILYPTNGGCLIVIGKFLLIISTILFVGLLFIGNVWVNANYGYMKSPLGKHKMIIREYTTGFRPTGNIEIYERVGLFFKKDTGGRIKLHKNPFCLDNGIKFDGGTKYLIEYNLVLEWLDEDTLHVYCEGKSKPVIEGDISEAIIKWSK